MQNTEDPFTWTATETLEYFKTNAITVETYARSLLTRIDERDGIVKAWAYLDQNLILKQARRLDKIPNDERGPLHGLAIGIKDVINTQDMPTQFGSQLYQGHHSNLDASVVSILRAAGALIFGKTTTTEFTVLNSGPETTNPNDPRRTPGGSSCGSAAAVADFQVPLSLGAQTGGSVIRPAAYTGVFAFKPTYNAISPAGANVFSPTFDTLGIFARSVDDLRLVADVFEIEGDARPTAFDIKDASVALIRTPSWDQAGLGTIAAMVKSADILRERGVNVNEISLPDSLGDGTTMRRTLQAVSYGEARTSFLAEYRKGKIQIHPMIQAIVENQANITPGERLRATDKLASLRPVVDEMFAAYSVVITPSAVDEAPLGLDDMGSPVFNTIWTALHVPVVHIPAFVGSSGMPIGVSLLSGRSCDQYLLEVCRILHEPLMAEGGWNLEPALASSSARVGVSKDPT